MIARRVAHTAGRAALLLLAVFVVLVPLTALAAPDGERRIALVIGVGGYQNAPHLANPVNDAHAIGDSLRRLKFDVTKIYDPDFRTLNSGVRTFGIRAATADVVVMYYAGHGVQVDSANYLSRMNRNHEGKDPPRLCGQNLDDPPIHIRPIVPASAGAKEKNHVGSGH